MQPGNKVLRLIGLIFSLIGAPFVVMGIIALSMLAGAYDEDLLIGGAIFAGMGVIFLILGLVFLFSDRSQRRFADRMMREGTPYDAEITRAYYNSFVQTNGKSPLVLECRYKDASGSVHLVKSKNLWEYNLLEAPTQFTARVWVEPYNPQKYYVEVIDQRPMPPADYDDR